MVDSISAQLASISSAVAKQGFEVQFNNLQNSLIKRFNNEVDKIEGSAAVKHKIDALQKESAKLASSLPVLEQYRVNNQNNYSQLDKILGDLSDLRDIIDDDNTVTADEVTAFTALRDKIAETFANLPLSPYIEAAPQADANGSISLQRWTEANGLPAGAHIDVGPIPNAKIPEIIAEADAALFPNRCEGGTNLVAMETMASGIPCILSANTGHLDIIGDGNCYVLGRQTAVAKEIEPSGVWRESDVDEVVETLEMAYNDRDDAKKRADAGVAFMRNLSWKNQTAALIDELVEYL